MRVESKGIFTLNHVRECALSLHDMVRSFVAA